MTVLYDDIVDEYTPVAVILTDNCDLFCTYPWNCVLSPATASEILTVDIVGTTVVGTEMVNVCDDAVPTLVLPEYVVTVTVALPLVALGIALSHVIGIA